MLLLRPQALGSPVSSVSLPGYTLFPDWNELHTKKSLESWGVGVSIDKTFILTHKQKLQTNFSLPYGTNWPCSCKKGPNTLDFSMSSKFLIYLSFAAYCITIIIHERKKIKSQNEKEANSHRKAFWILYSKRRYSDCILSGKQQKENGFESTFFLTDTLEAHKAEKQRLPIAGRKHIFSNKIMTWYIRQSYIIRILGLLTRRFFPCYVSLAIFNLTSFQNYFFIKIMFFILNSMLNWLKPEAYWKF